MKSPFLERRGPLGLSYALLILIVFFFLLPSAFQSARLSLREKENDVKDWLPSSFLETAELEWFAEHFAGESFVLATWEGCTGEDQRLKLLEEKLRHESLKHHRSAGGPEGSDDDYPRARELGHELELLDPGQNYFDWGGQREKWLVSADDRWYYITPEGRLYRWDAALNGPAAALRMLQRTVGQFELEGQLVTAFGRTENEGAVNPFYNDPSLLCAPLFQTVETGESIANELSREGGALWPIDLTDESERAKVARRRAIDRLTGTLFAPAVPPGFDWSPEAFRRQVPERRRDELPEPFGELVSFHVEQVIEERFEGERSELLKATTAEQTDAWYHVFDELEVEPPPRQTCVLVTLTPLAQDNLAYALGRGVLGGPRGRLLVLAEESGVRAAPPPSMAPPPFDRLDLGSASSAAGGAPSLRMGGPPVDNIAIDEEGSVTLVRLVGYSIVLGIGLSYLCFRSVKITVMVFIVGGSAAMLSMAMVGWTGGRVDAILMSMPSLVYVLGLSGAIHVVNYYRDELRLRGEGGAAGRALRHAVMPCTLASVTTAIGLISLFTSNLAPISNFGLYSACGVIATLAILFSYLPAALHVFAPEMNSGAETTSDRRPPSQVLSDAWASVGRTITRYHWLVAGGVAVVLAMVAVGIGKIQTSVQLLKLFDEDSRIVNDYAWLEHNFGKLVPMELVLRVPPSIQAEEAAPDGPTPEALSMLERAEAVARIRTAVYRTLGEPGRGIVGQTMSTDTFLPQLPEPASGYSPIRSRFNRELLESAGRLRDNDYLRLEESGPFAGSELWRISLRVAALSDVDYGRFISTLRSTVEPVLRAYDTRDALVRALARPRTDGETDETAGAPRVLVVGNNDPKPLNEIDLLSGDGETIDIDATFVATLGELLRGEPIQTPRWIEPTGEQAERLLADPRWETQLKQYDAVIWLGGEGFATEDFAAADRLVDATAIRGKRVEPILREDRIPDVRGAGNLQVIYTGVVPVVYKAQRTLLGSLSESIGLAFVLIALVMVVLLNPGRFPVSWFRPKNLASGLFAGAVSMIPNVFPVLMVFGAMGHADVLVGIGTMMTASVAMGVAVDDTIHFLSWFRMYLDEGRDRIEAVIETYRRVGPAMTQTTIVGGLGLFVFALSTFVPTQRFGTLMLVLLVTALIGDLVFLPALLAGPLGRLFRPRELGPRDETASAGGEGDESGPPGDAGRSQGHAAAESGGEVAVSQAASEDTAERAGGQTAGVGGDGERASEAEEPTPDREDSPHLKLHTPTHRTDPPHRVKR